MEVMINYDDSRELMNYIELMISSELHITYDNSWTT
jgi:hypothetical protein